MTSGPARILGLKRGLIEEGIDVDLILLDPNYEYEIDANSFYSKSKNCPFDGQTVKGKVTDVFLGRAHVVKDGSIK